MRGEHRRKARRESEERVGALVEKSIEIATQVPVLGSVVGIFQALASPGNSRIKDLEARVEALLANPGRLVRRGLAQIAQEPENQPMIAGAAHQALFGRWSARRCEWLAHVIVAGADADETGKRRREESMRLLDQLSDDQVILLCSHVGEFSSDEEWKARHRSVVTDPAWDQQASTWLDSEGAAFFISGLQKLHGVGLLSKLTIVDPWDPISREASPMATIFLRDIGLLPRPAPGLGVGQQPH